MKAQYVTATLLVLASVAIIGTAYRVHAADSDTPAAIYSHGTLHVEIPYTAPRAGAGILTIEVLNPEDGILGRSERHVDVADGKGSWQADVKLDKRLRHRRPGWHRLRYRFPYLGDAEAAIEGTESISQILRMPVVHILGQQSYLSGGPAAVRVIVTDSKNEAIAGASSVRIELVRPGQKAQVLFTGRLNRRGTTEAQFRFPAGLVGSYPLRYVVDTPIGSTEFTQPVRLEDKVSDPADHREAHLSARPDHPRARAGARPRRSPGGAPTAS